MSNLVCVPIPTHIYNELVLRVGSPEIDVTSIIESAVENYLERTADDDGWSDQYYEWRDHSLSIEQYGDPKKGYYWGKLYLPNGTKISMTYKQTQHHAEIMHEQLTFEGKTYSPSEWASKIANNTIRNAWQDLAIRRPSDAIWHEADDLRRHGLVMVK